MCLDAVLIKRLTEVIGKDLVLVDESVSSYLYDETPNPVRPVASGDVVVVKPGSALEVSKILLLANEFRVPVFPRGGGTGLVGGCIPTRSGIVVSLERMNRINVDRDNLFAEAEAGATLRDLISAAESAGLFFPPHPGDESAQIGGLIACNAGGVRAVKTGVMRNYVRGLEVVLPTGEIIMLGGKLLKNNAGYDLMQLIIGSEGTLGIITKAWIRLAPRPAASATIIIPFDNRRRAFELVPRIFQAGIIPLAIEYFEKSVMDLAAAEIGEKWPCNDGEYQLMVILAEQSEEALLKTCEVLLGLCEGAGSREPMFAESRREQDLILRIRSELYPVLKKTMYDTLDVTLPPASMAGFLDELDKIAGKYGVELPAIGHAGDGNLHVWINIREGWRPEDYEKIKEEVYDKVIELGGVITGEHGIGYVKRRDLQKYADPKVLELMKAIKRIFDPNNILNPDKIFL
jgi:glycolate oxidase